MLARRPDLGGHRRRGGRTTPRFQVAECLPIVYVYEDEEPSLKRYGFAVGTLPGHVERGEERFTVEWHEADDAVYYEVFAFSRPAHPLVKATQPLARRIQRRFAVDSLQSMARPEPSAEKKPTSGRIEAC